MSQKGPIKVKRRTKTRKRLTGRKRSGSVLVLIVLVVLVSLIIGTGLFALGTQVRVSAVDKVQDMMARSAADAGVEYATQQINNTVADKTWSESVLPTVANAQLSESDSFYSIDTQYDLAWGYLVQSTGTNRNRTRSIDAVLRLKGLFEMAIQTRETIILKGGTVIKAIDSNISLNPDDTDERAVIGTVSTNADSIILNNGVTVDGDVVVGVGGDTTTVIKDLGATVTDRYALPSEVEFPEVLPPTYIGPDGLIEVAVGEKTIGVGGDYAAAGRYDGIRMKQGTRLRIIDECILYITGDVDMGQDSEIVLEANATLIIYLDGSWISDNNSGINNTTNSPSAFQLFGTGGPGQIIDLKAKSDVFGVIYAPDATLTVFAGGDVYGAFVSNSFELKNPASFFYDVALQEVNVDDVGVRYVISRWNEQ